MHKSKKFRNAIKSCEDASGSSENPVTIANILDIPSKFMSTMLTSMTVKK